MRLILALLALLLAAPALADVSVSSPDGRTQVTISIDGDGRPLWQARRDGKPVILPSRLGFILADAPKLERHFAITASATTAQDERWEQPWGERQWVRDRHNQLTVDLMETSVLARRLALLVRVADDGIALRYVLPDQPNLSDHRR